MCANEDLVYTVLKEEWLLLLLLPAPAFKYLPSPPLLSPWAVTSCYSSQNAIYSCSPPYLSPSLSMIPTFFLFGDSS